MWCGQAKTTLMSLNIAVLAFSRPCGKTHSVFFANNNIMTKRGTLNTVIPERLIDHIIIHTWGLPWNLGTLDLKLELIEAEVGLVTFTES